MLFISCLQATGQQTPQFIMNGNYQVGGSHLFTNPQGNWRQDLYYPSDFQGAPAGNITRIYYQAYAAYLPVNFNIGNLLIKMGYLPQDENGDSMSFKSTAPVSFYPTDTVLFSSSFFIDTPVILGDWVGFTLQKPFYYNAVKNFIVEIQVDTLDVMWGLTTKGNVVGTAPLRSYTRGKGPSGTWNNINFAGGVQHLGFDIQPNDVRDVQNLSSFMLYPNPSEGKVNFSFETKQPIRQATLTVRNITGAIVYSEQYGNISERFSKQLDLKDFPRGLYLAELKADGEKITRKLVLQ